MRRLFTFFDSASPLVNALYWLSLWWMGQIVFLFACARFRLQDPSMLSSLIPTPLSPVAGGAAAAEPSDAVTTRGSDVVVTARSANIPDDSKYSPELTIVRR